MALLKLDFDKDGNLKITNPETNETMNIDYNQVWQLYDATQLHYYQEEVAEAIQVRVDNDELDPETAKELLEDPDFVRDTAYQYQDNLRKYDAICELEEECKNQALNSGLEERGQDR